MDKKSLQTLQLYFLKSIIKVNPNTVETYYNKKSWEPLKTSFKGSKVKKSILASPANKSVIGSFDYYT